MAQYDVYFQPVPEGEVHGFRCFEFGFAAALKVRGLLALRNRWLKVFMTPKGSDLLDTEYGTAFGNLPGANITGVTSDLQDLTNEAVLDATEQVKAQDIEGRFELDEQLLSATMLQYTESEDGIQLWVEIRNKAGESLATLAAVL